MLEESSGQRGWHERDQRTLKKLVEGKLTPEECVKRTMYLSCLYFFEALYSILYGSHKSILVERCAQASRSLRHEETYGSRINPDNLNETKQRWLRQSLLRIAWDRRRDKSFSRQLRKIVKNNPDAQILVIRGIAHRPYLEQLLKDANIKFKSYYFHDRSRLSYGAKLDSKLEKGEKPSERLILLSLVEGIWGGPTMSVQIEQDELQEQMEELSRMSTRKLTRWVEKNLPHLKPLASTASIYEGTPYA